VRHGPQRLIAGDALLLRSSGEHFDRRARELRQSKSIVEGIIHHSNRREDEQHESTKK
jgi:hypothetical protein